MSVVSLSGRNLFVLKGGGWYSDLYSSSKPGAADTGGASESKSESSGASEAKSEAKSETKSESSTKSDGAGKTKGKGKGKSAKAA